MSGRRCHFCGEDNPNVIEKHHIIPRRFGGSDKNTNLVTLCANCHRCIENLFDKDFYIRLASKVEECPFCGQKFIKDDKEKHIRRTKEKGHGEYGKIPEGVHLSSE